MPMRKAMIYHQNPIYLDKFQIPPCFVQMKFICLYLQLIWLCLSLVQWVLGGIFASVASMIRFRTLKIGVLSLFCFPAALMLFILTFVRDL